MRHVDARSKHVQMFHVKHPPALLARRVIERASASPARLRCAVFTQMLRIRAPCGPVPFRSEAFPQVALRRVASFRPRCRKYRNMWVKTARRQSGAGASTGEGLCTEQGSKNECFT